MLRPSSTDATARTGRDFGYCSMCPLRLYTQCQCLTPDTVWYLATVPFPQAGMPLPGCEALAADCWPAPVFLALADIVVAPNANAVTKIPINSFDVDTRLSSDCFVFSNHLTSALFRGSCLELCPFQRDVFISKHHRSSNISLQSHQQRPPDLPTPWLRNSASAAHLRSKGWAKALDRVPAATAAPVQASDGIFEPHFARSRHTVEPIG